MEDLMVTTVKVNSRKQMGRGIFEAIKFGVEYEILDDNTVEITCANDYKNELVLNAFNGQVVRQALYQDIHPY
jgi:hypothetical protein